METGQIFTAILGLVFVLGLALITISLIKWLQLKSPHWCFSSKLKTTQNIRIVEHHRIDAKNSVVLLETKQTSYLLLIGSDSPLLLDKTSKKVSKND